ncbi:gamma-glutamyltransferase family protein [Vibrio maritimus]|uniref:gamma-glutamyltransferase family protein n=1 Tax=Vibrio maritimus TaxID=990268 RepID=UPI00373653CF
MSYQTAFTAPHHEAAKVGKDILDAGGTACEAMVAAAAMIAVQYPHMNSIGGDGFWLISKAGEKPIAIDACGRAAAQVNIESYRVNGGEIPERGAQASITMAGTISGWQRALELNGGQHELSSLLQPAIKAASEGIEVTQSLADASNKTHTRLFEETEFARLFLPEGRPLKPGDRVSNPGLANTLSKLADAGLDDFYRGDLAKSMANDLATAGSPITLEDFSQYQAKVFAPLNVSISKGQLYNLGAPTQGLASLMILGIYDRLAHKANTELEHMHLLVEATKQAFIVRDSVITDEAYLTKPLQQYLEDDLLDTCASSISMSEAQPWPHQAKPGDTVWMGCSDQYGTMVSFIQSIYWEFGSGLVLPESGVLWNIRSKSFSLDSEHHNVLAPNKKPFHTLNPAYAELKDGTRMVYGTMGGEGQPQTQACLFSRYLYQGISLEESVALPRWLLGRTWGDTANNLRLEQDLYLKLGEQLGHMGHEVTMVSNNNELMGHAGAIALDEHGNASATSDPRSDGRYFLGESK